MSMSLHSYEIFLLLFFQTWMLATSDIYKSVMWTTNNPYFQNSNTSELKSFCLDGTLQMKVRLKSVLPIVCPFEFIIMQTLPSRPSTGVLYENIWIVYDKNSFETCKVNLTKQYDSEGKEHQNKKLYDCNTPDTLQHYMYSIEFKVKSPVMTGVYFEPYKTYYFLATSDGTPGSLNKTSGGHCNNDGDGKIRMKFQVYVCGTDDKNCSNTDEIGKFTCLKDTSSTSPPAKVSSVEPSPISTQSRSSSSICVCPSSDQTVEWKTTPSLTEPIVQPSYIYTNRSVSTTLMSSSYTSTACSNSTAGSNTSGGTSKQNRASDEELAKSRNIWRIVAILFLLLFIIMILILLYISYKLKRQQPLPCVFTDMKTVCPVKEKDVGYCNDNFHTNGGFNDVDGAQTPKSDKPFNDPCIKQPLTHGKEVEMSPVATEGFQGKAVQDKHAHIPHANINNSSNGGTNGSLTDNNPNHVQIRIEKSDDKQKKDFTANKKQDKVKKGLPPLKMPPREITANPRTESSVISNELQQLEFPSS